MTAPADETTTCANCGDDVPKQDWHPATVETTKTGDTVVRSFCSEHCREQWTSPSAESAGARSKPDTTAD